MDEMLLLLQTRIIADLRRCYPEHVDSAITSLLVKPKYSARFPGSVMEYSVNIFRAEWDPKSVVEAMLRHKFGTYWNQTETYEALKVYIQMDMDGLKNAVIRMLAREQIPIQTGTFENDMTTPKAIPAAFWKNPQSGSLRASSWY